MQISNKISSKELIEALVCGEPLRSAKLKELFQENSLIHVIIVSGSHFATIALILNLLHVPPFLVLGMLFVFLLASGMQPPGLLAFTFYVLKTLRMAHLQSTHILCLSGLLVMILSPHSSSSVSLYLSWTCTLILIFQTEYFQFKNKTHSFLLIPFTIYLSLNLWGGWNTWQNPITIFINLTLGTVISIFLFPMAALVWICPEFDLIFEFTTRQIYKILNSIQVIQDPLRFHWTIYHWIILIGLSFFFELGLIQKRRQKIAVEKNNP